MLEALWEAGLCNKSLRKRLESTDPWPCAYSVAAEEDRRRNYCDLQSMLDMLLKDCAPLCSPSSPFHTRQSFRGMVSATGTGASSPHTHTRDLLFHRGEWAETNYLPSPWKNSLFLSKLCTPQLETCKTKTSTIPKPKQERGSAVRGGCRTLQRASALLHTAGFESQEKTLQSTLQFDPPNTPVQSHTQEPLHHHSTITSR